MRESRNLCKTFFNQFEWKLVYCWDLLMWWTSSCPFHIQGREPYLYNFVFKKTTLACIQAVTDRFLSNLLRWYRPLSWTFLYQFGWPWPSFKVTVVWEIRNFGVRFIANLGTDLAEIQYVATPFGFIEAHAKFILHKSYRRERTCSEAILWNLHLTSSFVRTLENWFVSHLVWCLTLLNSSVWVEFTWPWCSLKVTGIQYS